MRKLICLLLLACAMTTLAQRHLFTPLNVTDTLSESKWKGQWIGIDRLQEGEDVEFKTRVNARYLRTEIDLKDVPLKSAKAYIATMGYYELFINGARIGTQVLAPQQTDFRKSIIYNTFDITKEIAAAGGKCAAVGVILGNGRTVPMRNNKHYKSPFFGFPKCRVEIVLTYENGSVQHVSSSNKWKATVEGPIRWNNEYDGELYDARMEMEGWALPDYDDSKWQQAERSDVPTGAMYPQTAPNQQATRLGELGIAKPKRVKGNVFDVRQNVAGWISLKVKGKEGDTIRVKYAERLKEDSTLYIANLRDAETQDVFVCNGKETWWHPTFVYHGFRYVEITGMEGVSEADIEPYLVADPVKSTGTFVTSNDVLNGIVRNAWWGILDNYKGFPVDCPQRNERQPWLGDRTAGSLGESFLFDNEKLYTRWMRDICDAQRWDGCIPDVAPAFWNYYSDDVTWPACLPFTCEMLYRQYGNDEAIRNSYPFIKRWLTHIMETYSKDGIITKDKYGDWCMPPEKPELIHSEDPARQTDGSLIATAYTIRCLKLMSDFAALQHLYNDAKSFELQAKAMTEAFNRKFLTVKRGTSPEPGHPLYPDSVYYGNNTATANILPLAFGLVPEDCKKDVVNNVVENIIVKNNGHVSCGVIGISHLLRTLTANGRGDIAYLIATNTSYPSWGYMLKNGATTIWELWNGDTANPAMNSGNHVMLLGDLLSWCYQDLGGISNAPGSMGYRHLDMRPDFSIQDLDSVYCSYKTAQGEVVSHWKKDLEKLWWKVTLPENTTADIHLPDGSVRHIASGTSVVEVSLLKKGLADDEFVYDHSLYPETHSSSIVELKDGTLVATYFGGTKERNPDVCIYTQRKEKGAEQWSVPVLAADGVFPAEPIAGTQSEVVEKYVPATTGAIKGSASPDALRTACWNPVLFLMPDGELWLFFKIGRNVKDWTGWLCKSNDGGMTWSEKEMLPKGFLGPIKNKPELIDGKLICPSSTEENGWQLHFEIYDIATGQWTKSFPKNREDVLAIQPAILKHAGGVLQVVARTRPTKKQAEGTENTRGKVATCWSYDNGMTWGETSLLDVPNNQSGLDAVTLSKPVSCVTSGGKKLKGVKHVMIHNDFGTLPGTRKGPRTPLSLSVSQDGITWHHLLTLEDSPISQYSYPSIIEGADGSLHCIYTWRRQRIAYKRLQLRR